MQDTAQPTASHRNTPEPTRAVSAGPTKDGAVRSTVDAPRCAGASDPLMEVSLRGDATTTAMEDEALQAMGALLDEDLAAGISLPTGAAPGSAPPQEAKHTTATIAPRLQRTCSKPRQL